jgi:hypothetical protein
MRGQEPYEKTREEEVGIEITGMIEGRQYACRAILALVKVRTMNIL